MNGIRNFTVGRKADEKYDLKSMDIAVNIVGSVAGGTGSGTFMDVAFLVREFLSSTDTLVGYILLPDIFRGLPATQNCDPNTYGAIKDLDHFMDLRTTGNTFKYTFGGRDIVVDKVPFDVVYIVNNTNADNVVYSSVDVLTEFLGIGLFLSTGSAGKGSDDIWDNLAAQITAQGKWWGKSPQYSCYGIAELYFDGAKFSKLYARQVALDLILGSLVGSDEHEDVSRDVENFIDLMEIREGEAGQVVEAVLAPGSYRRLNVPGDLSRGAVGSVLANIQGHMNSVEAEMQDEATRNLNALVKTKIKGLEDYLNGRLRRANGVQTTWNFLRELVPRLENFQQVMKEERRDEAKNLEQVESAIKVHREEAERAAAKFFGAKKSIETSVKQLRADVSAWSNAQQEIIRRDRAVNFFSQMLERCRKWMEQLDTIDKAASALVKELSAEIQRLRTVSRQMRAFTVDLEPEAYWEHRVPVQTEDFLQWLHDAKNTLLMDLADMRMEDLKNLVLEYAESLPDVQHMKTRTLEQVLRDVPLQERQRIVLQLDAMAVPLWQYDTGRVSGDKKTELIYIFGVQDADDTVLTSDEIREVIPMEYSPTVVSMGDPRRIICMKAEAAVPAFCIQSMERYREKYVDKNRPFSCHVDRRWESICADLFPEGEDQDRRMAWSLAVAEPFRLIVRQGTHYYVRSQQKGDPARGYLFRLAPNRIESMKQYLKDIDLVREVENRIETTVAQLGNERVSELLGMYVNQMRVEVERGATEEVRQQIESELSDVQQYIESLSTLA